MLILTRSLQLLLVLSLLKVINPKNSMYATISSLLSFSVYSFFLIFVSFFLLLATMKKDHLPSLVNVAQYGVELSDANGADVVFIYLF